MIGWFYNANMQIVQTKDVVMLLAEMNHDARIIPLTGDPREIDYLQWMGNSQGHWEGNVLIVETTGFRAEQSWLAFRMTDQLKVTECFELTSNDEVFYSYTFTDPGLYIEPVTVEKTSFGVKQVSNYLSTLAMRATILSLVFSQALGGLIWIPQIKLGRFGIV